MKVFVAGHRGMVGAALLRRYSREPGCEILTAERASLDLRDQAAVRTWFASQRPELVLLAAARVGGILANSRHPADFLADNLAIALNVIDAAWRCGTRKLVFLGSSCIYPKHAPQPMPESCLLTGPLEPTNEWYAVAKIAGIKLAQAYRAQHGFDAICLMPTNLYGPGDNFHPEHSHVLPALIRRFDEAARAGADEVVVWGSGKPRREFLHVDDLADATAFLAGCYSDPEIVNVGWGKDLGIAELAGLVAEATGFRGRIRFDASFPDGTPRKLLDTSRLARLGWQPRIGLKEGLVATVAWYRQAREEGRWRT